MNEKEKEIREDAEVRYVQLYQERDEARSWQNSLYKMLLALQKVNGEGY